MKKIWYSIASSAMLALPLVTFAQNDQTFRPEKISTFMQDILIFVNEIIIPFIIAIGFLVFVWGMFRYFIAGGSNDEAKEKGKSLMIWATLGFVLIIVFWGIINLLAGSTGLDDETLNEGLFPTAGTIDPSDGPNPGEVPET